MDVSATEQVLMLALVCARVLGSPREVMGRTLYSQVVHLSGKSRGH